MRRREFITLLGGAAVCPLAARAQQTERKRRIGMLNGMGETDPDVQAWDVAFRKRLDVLGWVDGRNVNIDYRWGAGNVERMQLFAKELVRLNPDVIVSFTTPATAALQAETRTIPIVFVAAPDPVGSGFVATLAKPGGNITGFISHESSLGSKWLQLLHDVAPQVSRVAFMYNPNTAPFAQYYLAPFQSAATKLAIDAIDTPVHSPAEIEAVMNMIGRRGDAGVIIMLAPFGCGGASNVAAATFSLAACQRRDRRRQFCRPGRL